MRCVSPLNALFTENTKLNCFYGIYVMERKTEYSIIFIYLSTEEVNCVLFAARDAVLVDMRMTDDIRNVRQAFPLFDVFVIENVCSIHPSQIGPNVSRSVDENGNEIKTF